MELFFDFEKPIISLEKKLEELREISSSDGVDLSREIATLEKKLQGLIQETYSKLGSWQRVQLSRHPNRPYTCDYLEALFPDFTELHGDRAFGDDAAIVAGTATWSLGDKKIPVAIIGHQKGRTTKQKVERNFGMARPEGYRKAIRLFELAERFRLPVITFIDTPGAYPGMDAEERGQSQAIAESILSMFELTVPTCSMVIGEGGSGGALAIGIGNCVLMQEFTTYSVISPESCAAILWSDSTQAARAAERLKITSKDLEALQLVDAVIEEPNGGAHRDKAGAIESMARTLETRFGPLALQDFKDPRSKTAQKIKNDRFKKFRKMGEFAFVPVQSGMKS
ncbi:MAG: acetyl-CoA carboxylase carboxyltransferase subunit alpha [Proteobacteria bacterium]|nr:acetyl-CoA carboxylase carboxyltransferase subunit alpha [Pseudomonadota bacterium]